ncbi:MAG: AsmA-like C-terminal region-containing protein, partial [Bacteroidia bacterium]|nr:AsmA-like C-terminal region-containing protein [Bacteroidia bacterium]MDW8334795.1 AsmA-like C-terminal region-containing protein [Bacteroidia bacterium]
ATLIARLSQNLKADLKNVRVDVDFSIADGIVSHPEIQRKLGLLIRKKYLRSIPFEFTGSNLRFDDGYLTVPELHLRTGIGTVTLEGRHYRTGRFRYRITLAPERRSDRVLISGLTRILAENPRKSLIAFIADGYKQKLKLRIDWRRIHERTIGKLVRNPPPVYRSKHTFF